MRTHAPPRCSLRGVQQNVHSGSRSNWKETRQTSPFFCAVTRQNLWPSQIWGSVYPCRTSADVASPLRTDVSRRRAFAVEDVRPRRGKGGRSGLNRCFKQKTLETAGPDDGVNPQIHQTRVVLIKQVREIANGCTKSFLLLLKEQVSLIRGGLSLQT